VSSAQPELLIKAGGRLIVPSTELSSRPYTETSARKLEGSWPGTWGRAV
jgi:hypothetical protein